MKVKSFRKIRRDAHAGFRSRGVALIFVLVMMTIATSIALISARITLSDERSSRNDRDRQIAFQSAEMALNDAELDIMDPDTVRGCSFGTAKLISGQNCSASATGRGLCGKDDALGNKPIYKDVNWDDTTASRKYVNYGEFTNRDGALQVGTPGAPSQAPKYILLQTGADVIVPYKTATGATTQYQTNTAYRVYALGYGASKDTQVMLESVIVKPIMSSKCVTGGGLG